MLNLYRNNTVIAALVAALVFIFGASPAFARDQSRSISYRTQFTQDLDGDHIPETATIRFCDHLYQVNIHFTTGRPKLRLSSYISEGTAGLTVHMTDINQDGRDEIVILSATSLRPLAIWINQGTAKFQKVSSWSFGLASHTGPDFRHRRTTQPEPVGNVSVDPLPQAMLRSAYLHVESNVLTTLGPEGSKLPVDCIHARVPVRGPPSATHI
jgi:hypothetical protein